MKNCKESVLRTTMEKITQPSHRLIINYCEPMFYREDYGYWICNHISAYDFVGDETTPPMTFPIKPPVCEVLLLCKNR